MRSDLGQPDLLHHRRGCVCAPRRGVEIGMRPQHLVDLAADRHHRVERRHRLLEDHRHAGGAQLPQAPVAGGEDSSPTQLTLPPAGTSAPFGKQAHHGRATSPTCPSRFRRPGTASRPRAPAAMTSGRSHRAGVGRAFSPEAGLRRLATCEDPSFAALDCFGYAAWFTCRPPAASCADRARHARHRRSG